MSSSDTRTWEVVRRTSSGVKKDHTPSHENSSMDDMIEAVANSQFKVVHLCANDKTDVVQPSTSDGTNGAQPSTTTTNSAVGGTSGTSGTSVTKPTVKRSSGRIRKIPQSFGKFATAKELKEAAKPVKKSVVKRKRPPMEEEEKEEGDLDDSDDDTNKKNKKDKKRPRHAEKEEKENENDDWDIEELNDDDDDDDDYSTGKKTSNTTKKNKRGEKKSKNDKKPNEKKKGEEKGEKGEKKSKEPESRLKPLLKPYELSVGSIFANIDIGRVLKVSPYDHEMRYVPLRTNDNEEPWTITCGKNMEMPSNLRYRKTVELNQTDLANKFIQCESTCPVRVSFHPVLNEKMLQAQVSKYLQELKSTSGDKEIKSIVKKIKHVDEKTIDCLLCEKNTIMGYSTVDDLSEPVKPTERRNYKTIQHAGIVQFTYLETRYRLKGSKFQDDKLIFITG